MVTQINKSLQCSIEDCLLWSRRGSSHRGSRHTAKRGAREQEHLRTVLVRELSQLLAVHLECRVFSLRVQTEPNSTEQRRKAGRRLLVVKGVWNRCHLHLQGYP